MMKLDIYKVVEGTDKWTIVETIEAETAEMCLEQAEANYNNEEYHWTNPY